MSDPDADTLPDYAYVPGGPFPHPNRSGRPAKTPGVPIAGDDWRGSPLYRRGWQLFDAGYYWETHEAWEFLWHAHDRRGPIADLLKALIKLAAAGVKVREGQPRGVTTHAGRARDLIDAVRQSAGPSLLGLDLDALSRFADALSLAPPTDYPPKDVAVARVFDEKLSPF